MSVSKTQSDRTREMLQDGGIIRLSGRYGGIPLVDPEMKLRL